MFSKYTIYFTAFVNQILKVFSSYFESISKIKDFYKCFFQIMMNNNIKHKINRDLYVNISDQCVD